MTRALAAIFLLGCASAEPVAHAPRPVPAPCPTCPAPKPPPEVSVAPDPARPEDLEKAKAILAAPAPPMETAPRFSPDGKRVAFVMSRALYVVEVGSKDPPKKIADLTRKFRRPMFSHDGAWMYFTSDDKGDEAWAVYRISLANGNVEPVAVEPKLHRANLYRGKNSFFFTSRAMTEAGVHVHELKGTTTSEIYTAPGVTTLDVSGDGARALTVDTGKDNAVFMVDLATKKASPFFPEPGRDVTIYDAVFSPDGKRVYIATDEGGERAQVLALDTMTRKVVARYTESRFVASRVHELIARGDHVAFIVDGGTRHELGVLDAKTLKPKKLADLPAGSEVPGAHHPNRTGGLALSEDGTRIALQWSTPASPPKVWLFDLKSGARTPIVDAKSSESPIETTVTTIPSWDGLALPTLVYAPPKANNLPVVVIIHGGFAFASTARFDPWINLLVSEGYVVVEPNVRGSGGFGRAFELADDGVKKLDAVRDLGAIGRWIAKQSWADPKRMALTGGSVGGYYTLLGLAHDPELWRVGVAMVAPYNLNSMLQATEGDLRNYLEKKELAPLSDPLIVAALSPATYVDRIKTPVLVYGALHDARAPIEEARAVVRALRVKNKPVELMISDQGHSLDDPTTRAELWARVLRFLKR